MGKTLLRVCLSLACLVAAQARAEVAEPLDLALIIGNNLHVEDAEWTLRFADDDALETAAHYEDLHPSGQIWLLVDPDAETTARRPQLVSMPHQTPTLDHWTRALAEMQQVVAQARAAREVEVRLFLHFSGHGEKGGQLHLADALLPPQAFRDGLARLDVDEVFALMDGCHLAQVIRSGNVTETVAPPPIFVEQDLAAPSRPAWLGFIGATTAVPEHDYLAGGLLTMVGVSGLLGPADLNGDQLITFFEWSRYIGNQVGEQALASGLLMVPPNGDWQSTVVDLSRSAARGVRIEPGFPEGRVRVTRGETRDLVAEFLYDGKRSVSLRLPAGEYDVTHVEPRDSWTSGFYPAQRVQVVVRTGLVSLGEGVATERIALVPENLRGGADLPDDMQALHISSREARSFANSPFAYSDAPSASRLPSTLNLSALVYAPGPGPQLSAAPAPHPGAALRVAVLTHPGGRGRWTSSVGGVAQYGAWQQVDLPADGALVAGVRHELRLGLAMEQAYNWRRLGVSVSEAVSWAPGGVTSDGQRLVDPSDPRGEWRYTYLRNVAFEGAVSGQWATGDHWSLGPVIRAEALRFQLSPLAVAGAGDVVSWAGQLSAGIELRQRIFGR